MRVIYTRLLITGVLLAAMWALTGAGPNEDSSPAIAPVDHSISAGH
jgi:hypothetical protein